MSTKWYESANPQLPVFAVISPVLMEYSPGPLICLESWAISWKLQSLTCHSMSTRCPTTSQPAAPPDYIGSCRTLPELPAPCCLQHLVSCPAPDLPRGSTSPEMNKTCVLSPRLWVPHLRYLRYSSLTHANWYSRTDTFSTTSSYFRLAGPLRDQFV
jgi:hypothetical protein